MKKSSSSIVYESPPKTFENPINLGDLLNYYPKYIKSLKQIPKIKTKNDIKQIVIQFSI